MIYIDKLIPDGIRVRQSVRAYIVHDSIGGGQDSEQYTDTHKHNGDAMRGLREGDTPSAPSCFLLPFCYEQFADYSNVEDEH